MARCSAAFFYRRISMMADAGIKNVVTITWRYTAGAEMIGGRPKTDGLQV